MLPGVIISFFFLTVSILFICNRRTKTFVWSLYKKCKHQRSTAIALFLIISLIIQTLLPLIQHRPGFLKSVEASEVEEAFSEDVLLGFFVNSFFH